MLLISILSLPGSVKLNAIDRYRQRLRVNSTRVRLQPNAGSVDGLPAILVFARLVQFAGNHGKAWPSDDTLGREVGLGDRQVRRCIAELERAGLLRRVARLGRSNQFQFLRHSLYDEGRTDVTTLPRTEMTAPPRTHLSRPPRADVSARKRISSINQS